MCIPMLFEQSDGTIVFADGWTRREWRNAEHYECWRATDRDDVLTWKDAAKHLQGLLDAKQGEVDELDAKAALLAYDLDDLR